MSWHRIFTILMMMWLAATTMASPVRRSPSGDPEARRRSAIDRSMIRFGRSYPAAMTAAAMRESFERPARRHNNFLRLGRSQPIKLSTEDLISLIKSYDDEDYDESVSKRGMDFLRLGRDPQFIRFGRTPDDDKYNGYETAADLIVNANQQRKARARNHFLRLGRDNEQLNEVAKEMDEQDVEEENRKKRSTATVS